MIKLHWNSPKEIVRRLKSRLELIRIAFLSLTYNEHLSWNYAFDTLMEPAIWFIDTFCKLLGPLFVTGFILLTSSAIFIAYHVGLPYYIQHKNPWYVAFVDILHNCSIKEVPNVSFYCLRFQSKLLEIFQDLNQCYSRIMPKPSNNA